MSVVEEIARRRLIQTAALYVAVAWGGTEILAFLIESLLGGDAANAARRYLAILLIAGFPAALYLGWTRDLGSRARRIGGAGAIAVLVAGLIVYLAPVPSGPPPTENSLAVLSFEVCEDRVGDRMLAGGLTGAVFARLAQRDRLKLVARRSVETVAASTSSLAAIADLLGVEHILSATVCRDGLDLTLHAELTDSKGFVTWEKDIRQVVNRSDQVEGQLASLVDDAVAAELGDATVAAADTAVDRRALEYLLIGQEYLRRRQVDEARTAFDNALAIEPDYAEAIYGLASLEIASCNIVRQLGDCVERARPIAMQALDRANAALQLNPDSFDGNTIAGDIDYALGLWENESSYRHSAGSDAKEIAAARVRAPDYFADAERHFTAALRLNPSATDVLVSLAASMDQQGVERRKEALELLSKGMQRDPFNEDLGSLLAFRQVEFGRHQEAIETLDRFRALPQGKSRDIWWTELELLQNEGRYAEKLASLIEILRTDPGVFGYYGNLGHLWWTAGDIAYLGLYDEAEGFYRGVSRIPARNDPEGQPFRQLFLEDFYRGATGHRKELAWSRVEKMAGMSNEQILAAWMPEAIANAQAFWDVGQRERALELLEALKDYRTSASLWAERQMWFMSYLARMYMQLDREDDARPLVDSVVSYLEAEVDAGVRHPDTLMQLAEAYGWQGNADAALETLDLAIDYGGYSIELCCGQYLANLALAEEPEKQWWNGLENDPRFIQSRSRMKSLVDQQRANVRSLLAQYDIDALVQPLILQTDTATSAN